MGTQKWAKIKANEEELCFLWPKCFMFSVLRKKTNYQHWLHTIQSLFLCLSPAPKILCFLFYLIDKTAEKTSKQVTLLSSNFFLLFLLWTENLTKFSASRENFIEIIFYCSLLNKTPRSLQLISFREIWNIKYVSQLALDLHLSLKGHQGLYSLITLSNLERATKM